MVKQRAFWCWYSLNIKMDNRSLLPPTIQKGSKCILDVRDGHLSSKFLLILTLRPITSQSKLSIMFHLIFITSFWKDEQLNIYQCDGNYTKWQTIFGTNIFNVNFDFSVWSTSHGGGRFHDLYLFGFTFGEQSHWPSLLSMVRPC